MIIFTWNHIIVYEKKWLTSVLNNPTGVHMSTNQLKPENIKTKLLNILISKFK